MLVPPFCLLRTFAEQSERRVVAGSFAVTLSPPKTPMTDRIDSLSRGFRQKFLTYQEFTE